MTTKQPVVVGHESALEFWRRAWVAGNGSVGDLLDHSFPDDLLIDLWTGVEQLDTFPSLHPSASLVDTGATHLGGLLGLTSPVSVVVEDERSRREPKGIRSSVWKHGVSSGLVAHVEDNVYVCAPELTFLQMAGLLGKAELIELAYEFCGDYVRLGSKLYSGRHYEDAARLTTPKRLRAACALYQGFRGAKTACLASECVLENSWSPRESQLAALLTMTRVQGGYGCGGAVLNKRIYLPDEYETVAERGYVVPDILFDAGNLCLEYQGVQHDGSEHRSSDDAKSNVLLMMGIETLKVWEKDLYDVSRMDLIAAHICSVLGRRRRKESVKMRQRREELIRAFEASSRRAQKQAS